MNAKNDDLGLDQLNALFVWWGVPTGKANGECGAEMKRFQDLVAGLQKAQSEAHQRQMAALYDTSQRVGVSLQAFPHCRKSDEVVAAGSTIVATIAESRTAEPGHRVEPVKAAENAAKPAKATVLSKRDVEGSAAPPAAKVA